MKAALQAPETGPQTRSNTPLHEAENEEGESFTTADSEYTEEEEEEDGVSVELLEQKIKALQSLKGKMQQSRQSYMPTNPAANTQVIPHHIPLPQPTTKTMPSVMQTNMPHAMHTMTYATVVNSPPPSAATGARPKAQATPQPISMEIEVPQPNTENPYENFSGEQLLEESAALMKELDEVTVQTEDPHANTEPTANWDDSMTAEEQFHEAMAKPVKKPAESKTLRRKKKY
jgi:hypothetical protein